MKFLTDIIISYGYTLPSSLKASSKLDAISVDISSPLADCNSRNALNCVTMLLQATAKSMKWGFVDLLIGEAYISPADQAIQARPGSEKGIVQTKE